MQAVLTPEIRFWRQIVRRRTAPLYRHPNLVPFPTDGSLVNINPYNDPNDGSITDGDDHIWLGDLSMLSGGRWREISNDRLLAKRTREDGSDEELIGSGATTPAADSVASQFDGEEVEDAEEVYHKLFFFTITYTLRILGTSHGPHASNPCRRIG